MSGFMFAFGYCIACGEMFGFNPLSVPSTSAVTSQREPVCATCMRVINAKRVAMKLEPFEIAADAYDPSDPPEAQLQ